MLKKYSFWILVLIFLLVSIQFLYSHVNLLMQEPAFDFETLYLSGSQALKGENPYFKLTNDTVRNPPVAILLYSSWALLPINLSETVWFVVSITIFMVSSYFLVKTLEKYNSNIFSTKNLSFWLIYLILVLRFFPFRWNAGSGQINALLFALISISFYLMQYKKNYWGTLALAIGILIKVTPLFILFNFLIKRKLKLIFYTIFNLMLIMSLTVFLFFLNGINIIKDYSSIPGLYFDFHTTNYHNQSLASFLTRLLENPQISQTITTVSLIIGVIIFIKTFYSKKDNFKLDLLSWNISILYMLIFAPFAWKYHFVIIIFPLLTTAFLLYTKEFKIKLWSILTISYLLIGFHFKSGYLLDHFNLFQSIIFPHVLIGTIILLLLNYYLIKKSLR